ncbi:MAG: exodeoxyribonuclease VII large subunit [Candidatus Dormibacteraeota bacterium]|nr:exodeoxyribonuclease VII large subunit [Candidatus Dormibacteraeota bacterium]
MLRPEEAERPWTVTELQQRIKGSLNQIGPVFVKGEVSGIRRNARGALSFDVKDGESLIRGWIWPDDLPRLAIHPEEGQQYLIRGRLDLWRTGNLMLYVRQLQYDDVGRLRAQLELLRRRLEREGAFDAERKRPLPHLPRRVALVTSPTGAVIHDLVETIQDRFPNMEILVYPAQVQGMASPDSVVAALGQCNAERLAQVVVVARGGGSFEELYAFNTEPVCRAILASAMPVVTALGHTSDRTLADLVADCECRTPTEAGARIVPRKADLAAALAERRRRLGREVEHRTRAEGERLRARRDRLEKVLPAMVRARRERLHACRSHLADLAPERQLERRAGALAERRVRLAGAARRVVLRRQADLQRRRGPERLRATLERRLRTAETALREGRRRLTALDPQQVLTRGYSIAFDEATGAVLRRATDTAPGRRFRLRLAEGQLRAATEEIEPSDDQI